ncbi:MAG TPA: MFS transporter [Streptosporangiaceae bacterium]|nr:MFS transporter [Streptosporangiaceae bacterium]
MNLPGRARLARRREAVSGGRGDGTLSGAGTPLALAILCTLLFLTFLDNTIVSVALGNVYTSLGASPAELQWVVGAYALTFASLMLACGMIGDEVGRKEVMLAGAATFCAGSVLSALAPNVQVLIAGRAVMGIGAAASEPGTLSMLRHLYPEARARSRAIGIWAATSGLALAAGPIIGGILIGLWNWRGIFWFNLVFGLTVLVIAALILPESADPTAARVDTAGTLLGAGTLAAFVFAIINSESAGFRSADVIALLCAAAVGLAAFVWRERRAAHPLFDLRYLRRPEFSTANLVAFCTSFSTFAVFFFTALYLDIVVGASGYQLALVFLPMTVLMIAASVLAGRWTAAAGPRWSITIGCLLFAAGLFLTNGYLSPHPDYGPLVAGLALVGIGIGTAVVPTTSSVLSAVPPARSGMAASATNTSREIGAVTGVVILGSLMFSRLQVSLIAHMNQLHIPAVIQHFAINAIETGNFVIPPGLPPSIKQLIQELTNVAYAAFGNGLHAVLYLAAALALAAALLALATLRGRPAGSPDALPGLARHPRQAAGRDRPHPADPSARVRRRYHPRRLTIQP